ncbi:MAG: hypothetical protein IJU37_11950 [Desulfovibrio sp.]|nr:hypothetical protein [Desulfovibrio sp.]
MNKKYLTEKGETVGVTPGLGGDCYIVARISATGSARRIKSPALPVCTTSELAQVKLDAYAQKKGWREISE